MKNIYLFTDGSVNTKTKIGFGAYLLVHDLELSLDLLKEKVIVKQFENTSSTKLELQTLLWAINQTETTPYNITIFTDSQNILSLLNRREEMELNNFCSRNNKLLNNHKLYKEFYAITDKLNCKFAKLDGHKKSSKKNNIDMIFTLVDRESRIALRKNQ